jgi:hypothetical protein
MLGSFVKRLNNGSTDISSLLKEINDQVKENYKLKNEKQILTYKRILFESMFKTPSKITLYFDNKNMRESRYTLNQSVDNQNRNEFKQRNSIKKQTSHMSLYEVNVDDNKDFVSRKDLLLSVKEIIMHKEHIGYVFKFETFASNDTNINSSSNLLKRKSYFLNTRSRLSLPMFKRSDFQHDDTLEIDERFIPRSDIKFFMNPQFKSFIINPVNPIELKRKIKDQSIQKYNLLFKNDISEEVDENSKLINNSGSNKSSDNDDSEDFDEDSVDSGESSSGLENESKAHSKRTSKKESSNNGEQVLTYKKNTLIKRNTIKRAQTKTNPIYPYKVKLDEIKLLVIDPATDTFKELKEEKYPHIEFRMELMSPKKVNFRQKNDKFPQGIIKSSIQNLPALNLNDNQGGNDSENNELLMKQMSDRRHKDGILFKQIEYSLKKKHDQPTITNLKFTSFLF